MLSSKDLLFIIEHKKTRARTLVFWFLMSDVFAPSDDIFILVEDTLDIVLVADDNQGCQSEDDDGENQIVAWENPTSQWEDEILARIATVTLEKEIILVK